jgi:integrase
VRLADSGGLYLEVNPNGSRRWLWKYRKDGREHGDPQLVPLPRQAVEILRAARLHRPVLHTCEIQTWHGFRATARTMLAERLECDPLVTEAQLAHSVKDANGRAYNRTQYIKQRAGMMQRWANCVAARGEDGESWAVGACF